MERMVVRRLMRGGECTQPWKKREIVRKEVGARPVLIPAPAPPGPVSTQKVEAARARWRRHFFLATPSGSLAIASDQARERAYGGGNPLSAAMRRVRRLSFLRLLCCRAGKPVHGNFVATEKVETWPARASFRMMRPNLPELSGPTPAQRAASRAHGDRRHGARHANFVSGSSCEAGRGVHQIERALPRCLIGPLPGAWGLAWGSRLAALGSSRVIVRMERPPSSRQGCLRDTGRSLQGGAPHPPEGAC